MSDQQNPNYFPPPRRRGLIFHGAGILFTAAGCGVSLLLALQLPIGAAFYSLMVLSVVLLMPLGLFLYRGYALLRASYTLERDGLRVRWGLRAEDIPLPSIEWVRPAVDMAYHLPLPLLSYPGAILGKRVIEGLGPVEFIGAEFDRMLLIATPDKIFAISPENPNAFIRTFKQTVELGSLTPLPSRSALPAAFLQRIWQDLPARYMILSSIVLTLLLFGLVSLLIPGRESLPMGFDISGQPTAWGPPERLLLLPILAIFTFFLDLSGGMFLYRRAEERGAAYLLWAAGAITPALLIVAALFLT
jgi:hypothetical protein